MFDYDVLFIGSGHACWHGAMLLAQAGKRVALAERDILAGTCTNYGCDAKILLDGPFELADGMQHYKNICIPETPKPIWEGLMAYKKQVIGAFPAALEVLFAQMGFAILRGHATLTDAHTVKVGEETVTAEYIVIGTGQRSAELDIPGKEYLHDSRQMLDLDTMPERIVFIGAGIISLEFAAMALGLGKQVTVIEYGSRALVSYPEAYVNTAVAKMQTQGAVFHFGEATSEVIQNADGSYTVRTKNNLEVTCDYVLNAAGRVANVEELGLEALGIAADRRGIVVNEFLQTSVPNIYASGDVLNKRIPKLTPTAAFESNYIAAHILGLNPAPIQYPAVPNVVFLLPRIAQVGVTVAEAKAAPDVYRIAEVPYGQLNLYQTKNEAEAHCTFIFSKENLLVGAAVYGADASSWIDVLTLIINCRLNALALGSMIFAFPTPTYGLISSLLLAFQPPQAN